MIVKLRPLSPFECESDWEPDLIREKDFSYGQTFKAYEKTVVQ